MNIIGILLNSCLNDVLCMLILSKYSFKGWNVLLRDIWFGKYKSINPTLVSTVCKVIWIVLSSLFINVALTLSLLTSISFNCVSIPLESTNDIVVNLLFSLSSSDIYNILLSCNSVFKYVCSVKSEWSLITFESISLLRT